MGDCRSSRAEGVAGQPGGVAGQPVGVAGQINCRRLKELRLLRLIGVMRSRTDKLVQLILCHGWDLAVSEPAAGDVAPLPTSGALQGVIVTRHTRAKAACRTGKVDINCPEPRVRSARILNPRKHLVPGCFKSDGGSVRVIWNLKCRCLGFSVSLNDARELPAATHQVDGS